MTTSEYRVLGPELGENDSFIDIEVVGTDGKKTTFSALNDNRTFTMSNERITALTDESVMVPLEETNPGAVWDRAADVAAGRGNVSNGFAAEKMEAAQRALFIAAYEESRP